MSKASQSSVTAETTARLPSRRRLLVGSGLVTLAAALALPLAVAPAHAAPFIDAMPPAHPDADLIAACMTFFEVEKAMYALDNDRPDEEHDAALDRYHQAYEVVEDIRPRSLIGLKAKTRVMMSGFEMCVASGKGDTVEDSAEWHESGVWHLLHDVLLLGSVVA